MAEGYHTAKKYERVDGSAKPTVKATLKGRGFDAPYTKQECRGALQICEIRVVKLLGGKKKSAQIYGTIAMHHNRGVCMLYNRNKNNAETINVPGPIELTPPTFCILPNDPVSVTFDFETKSEFDEMNEEVLSWMHCDRCGEVRLFPIEGKKSSVEVSFIGFDKAVLADIEIFLDEEQEIYGTINAFFSKKFEGLKPFSLFNKTKHGNVCVKAGQPIPLLRPFIAFPHGDGFFIDVELLTVSGDIVAQGNIEICPDRFGKWVGVLGKKDGEIQVTANVVLCAFDDHQPTIDVHEARCLPFNQ